MPLATGQPRAEPEHGGKAQGRRVTYVRLDGTRPASVPPARRARNYD